MRKTLFLCCFYFLCNTTFAQVGIGTTAPTQKLHVDSKIRVDGAEAGLWIDGRTTDWYFVRNTTNGGGFRIWNGDNRFYIKKTTGNIGIGTNSSTEQLHVAGNILATGTITPDYVFETYYDGTSSLKEDYKMMSLSEIEIFTKENKHLPGVPSAKEVEEKGGIVLNRASEIHLEKIEELFLHTIEQEKIINELKEEKNPLKERLTKIEKALNMQ